MPAYIYKYGKASRTNQCAISRTKANTGCGVCPECGSTNVSNIGQDITHIDGTKVCRDRFKCDDSTCEAEWHGDWYELTSST